MIIPVRCFSCGGLIAHKWEEFNEKKKAGTDVMTALDELGFDLYCCRRMFVSHIDLISEVAPFSAPRERA
ncbi:MAG TPA: DNA-directed RNA polymerase subunit N [Candidatus Poseidoniales archaeon]|jgi:DNA-directed RNA polymerase subunit N|nr:DNA-directed RNA polymerase subunit N [Candidatus Poseidoniaceae archaeon]RAH12150.1 MAG: DNA-directed RNA polymerase subunit N [Euryarchaeota archaeon]DAC39516.1 MAG TPA: DNA-directed RNA polymerase subunit N [Candidatus Poseidoniales archaeon]HIH57613.1 DNA-directed RNA polymerase subunit N [Candidatus Poseidoniaceae archaeon]|tara:strand:+ start:898 stop:1107 length:210 start_codon:yes stop_codon:yes gene_type:complete